MIATVYGDGFFPLSSSIVRAFWSSMSSPDTGASSRAAGTGSAGCSSCPRWSRSDTTRFEHFRLAETASLRETSIAQIVQSINREESMMARTKRSRRSYGAGEWGRNRVRVFPDPKTGLYQVEWRENGRRLTRSLGHREWVRAKRQADEFAAGFVGPDLNGKAEAEPEPLTLGGLFDIYGEEVTPTKGAHSRGHDRAAMHMFLRFFGRNRDPATLSQRDWDRFIRERRAGRIGPSGCRRSRQAQRKGGGRRTVP